MFKGLERFERLAKLKGFSGYHMGGFVLYDIQYIFIYCARNKVSRAIGSNARALRAFACLAWPGLAWLGLAWPGLAWLFLSIP